MVLTHEHGVAGIDPHKNSATIAVLDQRGGVVGSESFPISEEGIDQLLTFLLGIELTINRIGVEGSGFLGRPLVLALPAAGYTCGKSRPTAPPSGASAVVGPRPTSRTPKPSPARPWPTRTCLRPESTPHRARLGRHPPCPGTGAPPWSCNASGCSPRPKPYSSPCP